jgi:hypothetical protein
MAQVRICGVNIRIECDPNAELYYMHIEYRKEKELPINLGGLYNQKQYMG